jgi:hypothetical protein
MNIGEEERTDVCNEVGEKCQPESIRGTYLGGYLSLHPTHRIMSSTSSASTSRSNLDSIFNSALQAYKKKTGNDITSHPLANELQSCDSPNAILTVLRRQIPSLDNSQSDHEGFTKYLMPAVNVLYAFSAVLGEGVGLVCIVTPSLLKIRGLTSISQVFSLGNVIFSGIGVLLLVSHVFRFVVQPILMRSIFRQLKVSRLANAFSSIFSVELNTSSVDSKSTSKYHLLMP